MLKIERLNTGYDIKQVLYDLSMDVKGAEIVSIIGPNGAGKSTILKAVVGIVEAWEGKITLDGKDITFIPTYKKIREGITFSPQGNRVFDELKVNENLELGGFYLKKPKLKERIEYVLTLFPVLRDRLKETAGNLSGGERQMLALARALIPEPKLLLLDEPSLGLSPKLVSKVFGKLREINKSTGLPMLIVEQKVNEVLKISDRVYSIKLGKVAFEGAPELLSPERLKELFL